MRPTHLHVLASPPPSQELNSNGRGGGVRPVAAAAAAAAALASDLRAAARKSLSEALEAGSSRTQRAAVDLHHYRALRAGILPGRPAGGSPKSAAAAAAAAGAGQGVRDKAARLDKAIVGHSIRPAGRRSADLQIKAGGQGARPPALEPHEPHFAPEPLDGGEPHAEDSGVEQQSLSLGGSPGSDVPLAAGSPLAAAVLLRASSRGERGAWSGID